MRNKAVAITVGDVNGVGPEVIRKSLERLQLPLNRNLHIIAPHNIAYHEILTDDIMKQFCFKVVKSHTELEESDQNFVFTPESLPQYEAKRGPSATEVVS